METISVNEIVVRRSHRAIKPWLLEKITQSIAEHGYNVAYPIVVDSDGTLVEGRHRVEAAKRNGIESVPFIHKPADVSPIRYRMQCQQQKNICAPDDDPLVRWDGTDLVYFVQGENGGLIKIGYTNQIRKRLMTLQMGSPVILRVVAAILGNEELEQRIHGRFASLRKHGEWFDGAEELIVFAKQHPSEVWYA